MKKLKDIPRKQVFTTPGGYFDRLPGIIQSRIEAEQKQRFSFSWGVSLKYGLPALVIVVVLVFWLQPPPRDISGQLSMIDTEQIALYLEEIDITTEELTSEIEWSSDDLDELENDVYLNMDDSGLDDLIENIELDNL
jgi:hypothetical protein